MKVLVHLHTYNDAEVIDAAIARLADQSFPIERVLIVDNASTDGTLSRTFPSGIDVIHHDRNLGTSGSVRTGLEYALDRGFDWIWILDADSRPRADALERLVRIFEALEPTVQEETGILASTQYLAGSGQVVHGRLMTAGGPRLPKQDPDLPYCECDSVIWSGSLIRLEVVRKVGFPRTGRSGCWEDLSLDYGDLEYTYRIRRAGYRILVDPKSWLDHPIGSTREVRVLGWSLSSSNHSPFRRYLYFRNLVYFWLRIYPRRSWLPLLGWFTARTTLILVGIIGLEKERWAKIRACVAGARDGLLGRVDRTFPSRDGHVA